MSEIITNNFSETQKLGEEYAEQIKAGGVLCLEGELGAGKTTFTQGLLKGLGCEGPFTSPTFTIVKEYKVESMKYKVFHIDAYRITENDLDNLGWEEMLQNKNNIIIIEWPERIKSKIPAGAKWIRFEWVDLPRVGERSPRVEAGQDKRKLTF